MRAAVLLAAQSTTYGRTLKELPQESEGMVEEAVLR